MAKISMFSKNRIWIELERHNDDAVNVERARLASNMINKLGRPNRFEWFMWDEKRQTYIVTIDEAGGFMEMTDNGHWFNLDVLGADIAPPPPVHPAENIGSTTQADRNARPLGEILEE